MLLKHEKSFSKNSWNLLLPPWTCKKIICKETKARIIKGRIKWRLKNLVKVKLLTEKPPHNQWTISLPKNGIAENKLVITVAAQKLIWPQGRT